SVLAARGHQRERRGGEQHCHRHPHPAGALALDARFPQIHRRPPPRARYGIFLSVAAPPAVATCSAHGDTIVSSSSRYTLSLGMYEGARSAVLVPLTGS